MHTNRSRRLRGAVAIPVATAVAVLSLAGCNSDAGTGLWARGIDPVVLTGAQLGDLVGVEPGDVVAYRYDTTADAWDQVPVQVDERHIEHLDQLRNGTGSSGPTTLAYSDPGANAGPDPVATFDADDEVAFMADDTGGQAASGTGYPDGVTAGSGVQVTVTDPLAVAEPGRGSGVGYVYLFERSGSLPPGAGVDYVDYEFDPADPTGHAEDSTVSTDRYSHPLRGAVGARPHHVGRRARHPRPPSQPLRTRCLRAQRGHLLGWRGWLRQQHRWTGASDPLLPRSQQRHLHPA